jgi:hypothetical protein
MGGFVWLGLWQDKEFTLAFLMGEAWLEVSGTGFLFA